ncbi:MAG: NUDIX domain-containing protein [Thermoanaerobaculia bacterium]|nr:NUDIX domain-containing protein [Thermoanaerobaculia bacterium]
MVVPNVAALVFRGPARDAVLVQRRDKPGEVVRGRLELPGGRWRAGELPDVALAREVAEETGVELLAVSGALERLAPEPHVAFSIARPVAVVNGIDGAYPALHVLFECLGEGEPRPLDGETTDPRWWRVAELLDHLEAAPEDFVWHTAAMLRAYFG